MISPTLGVRYDEPCGATVEKMRSVGIEHIIVTQENKICGVVSERELAYASRLNPNTSVGELATVAPIVESEAAISDAAHLMRMNKVGCLPVVDDAAIAGVITIDKLLDLIGEGVVQAMRRRR